MQTHTYRDFDAFASAVGNVDAVMMLQNPKRRSWTINRVDLSGMHVQLGRLGSGNIVEGESWSNGYLLYLPLTNAVEYSANGEVLPKNSFMILEPGCDFCLSTKFAHDWCSIFFPTHKFAREGVVESSGAEKMTCRAARANRRVANRFRVLLDEVMTAAVNCPQFESTPAATCVAAELLKVGSQAVGLRQATESKQDGRPRTPRQEIIRCSQELLEERHGENVLVEELASAADVSERTLRTAFNEYFGVGPVQYLQLMRLHQVRRKLRAADPEAVSVSDVLVRHGEWEFSRFAARYRRLFGELPSETLRSKSRASSA